MMKRRILVACGLVATLVAGLFAKQWGQGQSLRHENTRDLLRRDHFQDARRELIRRGESEFPVYEWILNDPAADRDELAGIFLVLCDLKVDRGRFVKYAVRSLAHAHPTVRHCAAKFLGEIGDARNSPPIVALLWDAERSITWAAADVLKRIGSEPELAALDIWLRAGNHRLDDEIRRHVQSVRDELNQKIAAEKKRSKPKEG